MPMTLARQLVRRTASLTRSCACSKSTQAVAALPVDTSVSAVAPLAVKQPQSEGEYPGHQRLPYTSELEIVKPEKHAKWPVYRVLDNDGSLREGAEDPRLDQELARKMYTTMVRLHALDQIFYNAQRQGRISFYMTSFGEEACHIGSAAALSGDDMVFAQYREQGVLMWRGFTLEDFADQCFSNAADLGKGRQMPVHYGTAALNYQTISSPLATQIPQAVGAAYSMKISKEPCVVITYFGEGAASEGDFHAALNFASTLECPIIFFCRNNGFAISTPVKDQYRGDGIVSRAIGYGMHAIRVDGNDVLAVYNATKAARDLCTEEKKPVLIEAMTYRIGHHSTSDDSTRYRSLAEIKQWQDLDNPLVRFRKHLESKGWWTDEDEAKARDEERMGVLRAIQAAESKPKPHIDELFTDVYSSKPRHLREQECQLHQHLAKHPGQYL